MRSLASVAFIGLLTTTVAAQELRLPGFLYGIWESDIANCNQPAPMSGYQIEFVRGEGDNPDLINFVDWETEGGSCEVVMVDGQIPTLSIAANCAAEEGEGEASTFDIHTGPDGETLSYQPNLSVGAVVHHRCL